MTTNTSSKSTVADLATQLVAGTQKHLASMASLMFASGSYTPAQIVTQLTQLVTLRAGVDAAKAALQGKLAAEAVQAPALLTLLREYAQFVKTTYSKSPDVLADFGLTPDKARTPLTVEQKAAATAKRAATRAARGTKGSKAKAAIKGNVTGVVLTPVTASPPAAPAAPTAASGTNAASVVQAASAPTTPSAHS